LRPSGFSAVIIENSSEGSVVRQAVRLLLMR
jgi:hypothetical protein